MTDPVPTNGHGLSLRDLVLRVDTKLDAFIVAHAVEHRNLTAPEELDRTAHMVTSHERTIQRITGALILLSALGIGTLVILVLRITGIVR